MTKTRVALSVDLPVENHPFMQDVADAVGVHRTTVSLALRDHPRISAATRARVKAAAEKLGYSADPFLAVLMQARRLRKPTPKFAALAYVTAHATRYGWRQTSLLPDFFPGAAARAQALGYKLEDFWLTEQGMTPERLRSIFAARNIRGAILAPPPPGVRSLDLAGGNLAMVTIGVGLEQPQVHRVADNHFESSKLALTCCVERGFRRIGLYLNVVNQHFPNVTERRLGAYLACGMGLSRMQSFPPFIDDGRTKKDFVTWLKRHRPEAIVTGSPDILRSKLKGAGLSVPADVSVATFRVLDPKGGWAGIYHDPAITGATAADTLIGLLHRNEYGLPEQAHYVAIDGLWIDRPSLRPRV